MPADAQRAPHALLNGLPLAEARAALERCCGAARWVGAMLALRPFASREALFESAERIWAALGRDDYLEAFSDHAEIGADLEVLRDEFASAEQAGVAGADDATLERLRDGNLEYHDRFGFVFIVCASGKSAAELLALLEARLHNDPETELAIAAREQLAITRLRLEKIGA